MKKTINPSLMKLLFLPLIILMTFTACQDEVIEITDVNDQEVLVANSALANLMQNTALRDGSFDNIIDNANCISINLPVTIIVNGIEITIDSEEDLAVIEAIFDQYSDDVDAIEIVFPITIILNDYTEIVINNLEELEQFIEECTGENEDDDDIECIDFQYPISISVFNSAFEVINTVEINSDEELYEFIEDLEGGLLAGINFPVTMVKADGTTVVVNNNDELQAAIEAAEDTCDEDDDNDYDDDDENDIPVDDLNILCSNCTWEVARLELNNENLEDQYDGYVFTFVPEGPVKVVDPNGTLYEGTWGLTENDNGIPALTLNIPDLPDFNNELWLLSQIIEDGDDIYVDFRNGEDRLKFERLECEDNDPTVCSESDVDGYLAECHWTGDINGTADFNDYDFYFNEGQELKAYNTIDNTAVYGTWTTSENNDGDAVVTIEMPSPLQDFNGEWTVIECNEERIKITLGDDYIVYERECEEDACTEEQVDAYLVECIWNIVSLTGSDGLISFDLDFVNDGTLTITGNGQTISAFWSTTVVADGVLVGFDGVNGPEIQAITGSWLITECASDRFKMFNDNQDYIILEQDCGNNTGDCTEGDVDGTLQNCVWTISSYAGDESFNIFSMDFGPNQDLEITATGSTEAYTANWSTSQGTSGVEVEISNVSGGNVQIIAATYVVVECTGDQMILHDVTDSSKELVLDKNCN